jgi:RNA polymerase sigma-70 factor (sigma-E family)
MEPDGFRDFVVARSPALLRTGRLITGQESTAQDLLQTALLKTWGRWDHVERDNAEAYVRRVMVTTYLTWRRRRWSGEQPVAELPESEVSGDAFAEVDLSDALCHALKTLTPKQRTVIVLRYFDDLSEVATAQVLNCSVGTVKSQTSKALRNLRQGPLNHLFAEEASDDIR